MENPLEGWNAQVESKNILREFTAKKPVPEVISRQSVFDYGKKINRPIIRAFYYFLYLTGARISEALLVSRNDIQYEELKGEPIITIKLRTLKKKRGSKIRVIPVWISGDKNSIEHNMWCVIKPFITRVSSGYIFNLGGSVQRVRRRIGYYFGKDIQITSMAVYRMDFLDNYVFKMYPHYLRHCRLTHLAQLYGFDALKLMHFAGWSSIRPAIIYLHYNWINLASWMVQ